MPTKHGLGFGNGRLVEYDDGTVAYYKPGELTQSFRVPIAAERELALQAETSYKRLVQDQLADAPARTAT